MSVTAKVKGFTLAELLIALAVLGVIATFTIPKILVGQQDAKRKAILKETLSTIATITAVGWQTGELNDTQNGSYILDHLNVVKLCDTNADAQGCWTQAIPDNTEETEPGAVMHNGATIGGLSDTSGWNWIFVDWNGNAPPNVEGEDQLKLMLCFDPSGSCGYAWNFSGSVRPLTGFESEDLYQEVFSQ